ncbi:hypothetical protein [Paraburkholderia kirstenboschensis]|uniref:hypothetical protein n=1 Tax=Paraburkholderia kirstenboschensis TaxID=1245436 RepID=UPI0018743304|nr:hypothetical protein [Paraburkholderia kirstenboschensis]
MSIVDASDEPGTLLVRARRQGDIEAVFPDAKVTQSVGRDYLYRAGIAREEVAAALAEQIMRLDYPNFKSSVADPRLHAAYSSTWSIMSQLQEYAPYHTTPRPGFRAHPLR